METKERINEVITTVKNTTVFNDDIKNIIISALNKAKDGPSKENSKQLSEMTSEELNDEATKCIEKLKEITVYQMEKDKTACFFGAYNGGLSTRKNCVGIVGKSLALAASVGALYLSDEDMRLILNDGVTKAIEIEMTKSLFKD